MDNKKMKPVTGELVQQILNGADSYASYGCGCGSGSGCGCGESGWYPAGCGCGDGGGSGSGLGLVVTSQPYPGVKLSDNIMKKPCTCYATERIAVFKPNHQKPTVAVCQWLFKPDIRFGGRQR